MKNVYIILGLLVWLMPWAEADEGIVDPALSIPVFLKIISFDDTFLNGHYAAIHVRIVYDKNSEASLEQFVKARDFFYDHPKIKVNGVPVDFDGIECDDLESDLTLSGDSVYIACFITGMADKWLPTILSVSAKRSAHTFAFDHTLVSKGISVGLKPEKKRNPIIVNLEAADREGSVLSAHLLKMCEIYKAGD